MGKQERAMKREGHEGRVLVRSSASEVTGEAPAPKLLAVALIADGGGYRIAKISLPVDVIDMFEPQLSEPEVLGVQLPLAVQALEDHIRGESDDEAVKAQHTCPKCGANSLRRHPTKPVRVCSNGACNARIEGHA